MAGATLATTLIVPSRPAQAVVIGGICPTPFYAGPCIIFDYKRLAEMAKTRAKQVEALQDMKTQVDETKQNAEAIGKSIAAIPRISPADIAIGDGSTFTSMTGSTHSQLMSSFSDRMFGGEDLSIDEQTTYYTQRREEDMRANSDALATALTAPFLAEQSRRRMVCLGKAAQKTTDLRGDWAVNTQIKLELARQNAQKNHLLSAYLSNSAVELANNSAMNQPKTVRHGQVNGPVSTPSRSPAWDLQDQLEAVEGLIRTTMTALAIAEAAKTVVQDADSIEQRYENAKASRDKALAKFQTRARSWSSKRATTIVNTTLNRLTAMDAQLAAARSKPLSQLTKEFRDRNINVAEMTNPEIDVDPRQFIGTWSDPIKFKLTRDLANSLLSRELDDYIDGDDDNDEFRELVYEYNDARFEEAWLRPYAEEARLLASQTTNVIKEESDTEGYSLTPEAARARLQELVSQANSLGQQIQQTGETAAMAQAAGTLKNINDVLNPPADEEEPAGNPANSNQTATARNSPSSVQSSGWTPRASAQ